MALQLSDVTASIERSIVDKTNSGFLAQIDEYVRGRGLFIATVDGSRSDPTTMLYFRKPIEVPQVWLALGAALLGGVAIGFAAARRRARV